MHLSTPVQLLSLATLATAIDVKLFDNTQCSGPGVTWTNVQPNVCYAWNNDAHGSALWSAIPWQWHTNMGAYRNGDCKTLVTSADVNDHPNLCLGASGRILTGARYHFRNDKRAAAPDTCSSGSGAPEQKRGPCVQVPPNKVTLADGSVYDATGLEHEAVNALIAFAYNGSSPAEIPAEYKKLAEVDELPEGVYFAGV